MNKLLIGLLLLLPFGVEARMQDFHIPFSMVCQTVDGESLDADGDGICEMLNGFRVYDDLGNFVTGIAEDGTRTISLTHNVKWGEQCLRMTAHMTDPTDGTDLESDFSNRGACVTVRPGKPVPPEHRN
jgi:hypothetical protein